jgi:vitamin B12 transporter
MSLRPAQRAGPFGAGCVAARESASIAAAPQRACKVVAPLPILEEAVCVNPGFSGALACLFLASLPMAAALANESAGQSEQTANSTDRRAEPVEEVVVTSSKIRVSRRQLGVAVSVIEGAEIELRGLATLADVLRTQPGIAVSSNGGPGQSTSVRVRGEEGFRTLALIDGVKISDPTTPQVGPRFDHLLTTSDLERVEILRGPQGFIYGADAGGVINVLSRSGEGTPGGSLGLELGAFGTRILDAAFEGGSDYGDFFFSVKDVEIDGFNVRANDLELADDDGYQNNTLHTKLGWQVAERLRLQLVARDVDARTEYDGCGFPATNDCSGASRQTTMRLSAKHTAGRFTNDIAVSTLKLESQDFTDGVAAFSTDGELVRAEYTGSFKPDDTMALVYGIDLQREDIVNSGDDLSRDQFAYYFEYQSRIGDQLFVTAGARFDDNDDFGGHTSARISAAYLQDSVQGATLKYRASVGTGFRSPSLFETAYNRGPFAFTPASRTDLVEESTTGFDVGVEYRAATGTRVELTYFDQQIDDEIFFDLATFSGYLQDRGESSSRGLELAVELPLLERWSILGNLTYNKTANNSGQQRIRRPELTGNLGVRFNTVGDRLRLLANYRLSRDAVDEVFPAGRVILENYEVLDVSSAFAINDAVEVYARLENLLDDDYEEVAGFESAGRAAFAGIRIRF